MNLQLLEEYQVSKRSLSVSTRAAYVYEIGRLLKFLDRPLEEIQAEDIEQFMRLREGWSPSTANRAMAAFTSFWKYLVKRKRVSYNIMSEIERYKRKEEYSAHFKRNEANHIRRRAASLDPPTGIMVELIYFTGCRISELIGANVTALDLETREFKVMGKGGRERYLRFPESQREPLEAYLLWRSRTVITDEPALIINENTGRRLNRHQASYRFKRLSRSCLIHVNPHALRHTFATEAIERGMKERVLQILMGHKHITTTQRYIHTTPDVAAAYDQAFP